MSVWDWVDDYERDAYTTGEPKRIEIVQRFHEAMHYFETDANQTLTLLKKGRDLAQLLNDGWWMLLFDHWTLQLLLHQQRDYVTALDLAVKTAVEARKPVYGNLPQRICLHEDLIAAYIGIDPAGYEQAIRESLDYMATQISPTLECRYCLQGWRCEFELVRERWDEADAESSRYLALSEADDEPHYRASARAYLCELAYHKGDWQTILDVVKEGQLYAQRADRKQKRIDFLAWEALALRKLGSEDSAATIYRTAVAQMSRLDVVPSESYYKALTAYHEANGDFADALKMQDEHLGHLTGKGQIGLECEVRLWRLRLMGKLGMPLADDLAAARQAASKLLNPAPILAKLDRLASGDYQSNP
jgi:hypothetical protein